MLRIVVQRHGDCWTGGQTHFMSSHASHLVLMLSRVGIVLTYAIVEGLYGYINKTWDWILQHFRHF